MATKRKRKTGRAIHYWSGMDSYTRRYQYAMRDDGAFFYREHGFNGYGTGWSRWTPCADPRDAEGIVRGGFGSDPDHFSEEADGRLGLRLPAPPEAAA